MPSDFSLIKRSLDHNDLGDKLKDPLKNRKENDLIRTDLLLDHDVKKIRLFQSGNDVNVGDVFVATVDFVEGHRRVTLTKREEGVKDE